MRALITGASSGIGEAIASEFAKAGFDLALVARSTAKLTHLTHSLNALGISAQGFTIDLSDVEQVHVKIAAVIAQVGPIDVLINNAGMGYTGSLIEMPLVDWQQVMALNVTSVFQVVQTVLPGMRQQASGLIINIASIAAQQSFAGWGAYGVSKAALAALTEAIATEESAHGIRAVTLFLGAVDTPLWDSDTVQAQLDRTAMLSCQTVAQTVLHTALLPPDAVISQLTLTPSRGALS